MFKCIIKSKSNPGGLSKSEMYTNLKKRTNLFDDDSKMSLSQKSNRLHQRKMIDDAIGAGYYVGYAELPSYDDKVVTMLEKSGSEILFDL